MLFGNKPQFSIENTGHSMRITIHPKRNWFILFFLGVWLFGWLFGELFALGALLAVIFTQFGSVFSFIPMPEIVDGFSEFGWIVGVFLLIWLAFWTKGGLTALRSFLWQLRGEEIVEVGRQGIQLSQPIFGTGKVNEYKASEVVDLRRAEGKAIPRSGSGQVMPDSLEFDYMFETVGFGAGLEEKAADELLETVYKRYPQYKPETIE
jgi:hypothetical protein